MPETINDRITYAFVDRVVRIELAHGQAHNSLDGQMGQALRQAAQRAEADVRLHDARVVLVSAQGRTFSVGGDLAEFGSSADRGAQVKATADGLHAGLAMLRGLEVPVVSAINGTAAGGGLGIALCGDIVLAAAEAKLVFAYTASGLTPDCGLTSIVPQRVSWVRAMDLALTNRMITGAEAAEWGLVSRAVARDELAATVEVVVADLRDGAATALADTKRLMAASRDLGYAAQMDEEAASIARNIASPDGIAGVDAFLAKRRPAFN